MGIALAKTREPAIVGGEARGLEVDVAVKTKHHADARIDDLAPDPILQGGLDSLEFLEPDDRLVLFGDTNVIEAGIASAGVDRTCIEIVGTTESIGMEESPVEAVRSKADSSMVKLCQMASRKAGDIRLDAVISAGNTGAFVAASQMFMRRLPNVARPGIAAVVPTFGGPVVFIDVGDEYLI